MTFPQSLDFRMATSGVTLSCSMEIRLLNITLWSGVLTPVKQNKPCHEETVQQCGFRTGPTQTKLYKLRRWLEARNFTLRKRKNCTILVAKTKVLISFAFTAKLICPFVFAYSKCWFSHDMAQIRNFQMHYGSRGLKGPFLVTNALLKGRIKN